jgi:hypothetical protein
MADRRTDCRDEAIKRFWRLKKNTPKNRFCLCLSWLFPWCFPPACRASLKWTLISWSSRFTDLGRTGFYRQLCTPVMERTKLQSLRGASWIGLLPTERTHPRGTTRVSTALCLISNSNAWDALLGCDSDTLKLNKDIVLVLMNFPSWLIALTWSH